MTDCRCVTMRRSSYFRSCLIFYLVVIGHDRVATSVRFLFSSFPFSMTSPVPETEIDAAHAECTCTIHGVNYYEILSLENHCNDVEIKQA